jgi:hypothetical protein
LGKAGSVLVWSGRASTEVRLGEVSPGLVEQGWVGSGAAR